MATEMCQKVKYIQKGKYRVSTELFLDLVFTDKCNCKCPFCISRTKTFAKDNYQRWKKNLKRTFDIFDIRNVIILGGEATIDPLFFEKLYILEEVIRTKKVDNVILTTNGIMLRQEDFLDKLINSCVSTVNLSYMNQNKKINDSIMGGNTLTKKELHHIHNRLNNADMTMRLNANVFKNNCDSLEKIEQYVETLYGCADIIKFSPLMKTDMFHTENMVEKFTNEVCFSREQIKKIYDSIAQKYEVVRENEGVFGLIPYKELSLNGQGVILKYMQVEDQYDLEQVIPTLKLYYNGNLSNEWNYQKNILGDFIY